MSKLNAHGKERAYAPVGEKSLTRQSFKDECDINKIVARGLKTGLYPYYSGGKDGDFTNATDFQTALNTVIEAQRQFDSLPSKLRDRFHNDPAKFLEFATNAENQNELIKLGIAKPKEGFNSDGTPIVKTPNEPLSDIKK